MIDLNEAKPQDGEPLEHGAFILAAALDYAANGLPVFPVDSDKKPLTDHGYKDATTDPAKIRGMFAMDSVAGIGIPTGPVSGVLVIDRDRKNGVDGIEACKALEATLGTLPATRRQRTGSGGDQLFYKWPEGSEVRNSASKIASGVDIRGAGGYVVVPPSRNSAGAYEWMNDCEPVDLPRAWLERLTAKARPERIPCPAISATESTPYGRKALQDECKALESAPEGQRNDCLNDAAFAVGQLVTGGEIVEAEALTALEHAAAACGLSEREADKTIRSGFEAGKNSPRKPQEQAGPPSTWPDFVPFDEIPPDLPAGILPGILGDFSEALAEATQTPRELAAINALGVAALCVQGKAIVRVKPDYSEGLNLYAIVASEPGERKSAVVAACKAPVVAWEIEQEQHAQAAIHEALSMRKTMEKAIDKARTKAAGAKTAEERKTAARAIHEMELELPEVPPLPRMLVDDVTPEALAAVMAGSGESIGMLEAEGGALDTFSGRYSNSVPNVDLILKAFGAEPVVIDRKGKEPIRLRKPRLTMVLTPQPSVLRAAGGNAVFMGRGLVARCILALPRPRVGFRDNARSLAPQATREWEAFVDYLLKIQAGPVPHEIRLAPEAFKAWLGFSEAVEVAQRPGGEFEFMRAWASKLTGLVVRIAGLFHLALGGSENGEISPLTMQTAVRFATWTAQHAKHAFSCFGLDDGQEAAKGVLDWLRKEQREIVTARQVYKATQGRFPTMDQLRPGLAVLVDRGALVEMDRRPATSKGGRPSESFAVNPAIYAA